MLRLRRLAGQSHITLQLLGLCAEHPANHSATWMMPRLRNVWWRKHPSLTPLQRTETPCWSKNHHMTMSQTWGTNLNGPRNLVVLTTGVNDFDLYWHYPSPCLHGNVWPCLTALSSLCRARSRLSLWPGRKFRLMMRRATTSAHQRKLLKLLLKEYIHTYIYILYIIYK